MGSGGFGAVFFFFFFCLFPRGGLEVGLPQKVLVHVRLPCWLYLVITFSLSFRS